MTLRNVFMTAIACSALIFAAGNKNNGMSDTSDTGTNGSMMDTVTVSGTIQEYNEKDSMLVVKSDTGTDTLYISSMSQIPQKDQLKKGKNVNVRYMMQNNRKEVISIEPSGPASYKISDKGSSNANKEKMITGTIQQVNESDSMLIVRSSSGQGTDTLYYNKYTKMNKSEIRQGEKVHIQYRTTEGRKVATKITKSSGGTTK